ncbi:MAG: type 1 glutamine amidotransferase [bacterium]|nr:type 1 glutamine amidotransferase [bacterium]
MKVAVLVEDQYQVLEAWYPYLRLRESGIETVFVGTGRKKEYGSKEGYPAPDECPIVRARANGFAGVIIPGGYAPDLLRRDERILALVRETNRAGKLVASICHGGWVLASAGILRGRRVTSFSAIREDIVNAGAEFVDREVVVDGNFVTSRKPEDLPAFCREILAFLTS